MTRERSLEGKGWSLPTTRASLLILQESGGGPLHYKDIAGSIVERRLVVSSSKNICRVVHSSMSKQIRMQAEHSWFRHAGPGLYALTEVGRKAQVWRHCCVPRFDEALWEA